MSQNNSNNISISSSSVISNLIWNANNPPIPISYFNRPITNNKNNNKNPIRYDYQYQNQVDRYSFPSMTKYTFQSNESIYRSNNAKRRRRREIIFNGRHRKNYQVVESRAINGFRKIYTYYIDGIKCDGFGRIPGDPGFAGIPKNPDYPKALIPIIK